MIWRAVKLTNLSVLVHENDGSIHLHLKCYLLHVSARSEGVEIYNSDSKFSILGASFTGIAKKARALSHRCNITYDGTASKLPPEIHVDHVHMITLVCYAPPPPPRTWDRGITKILTFSSAKLGYMPCTKRTF